MIVVRRRFGVASDLERGLLFDQAMGRIGMALAGVAAAYLMAMAAGALATKAILWLA